VYAGAELKVFWFFSSEKNTLILKLRASTGIAMKRYGVICLFGMAVSAHAAPPDPLQIFAPLSLPTPPGDTRTSGGLPGPAYWQNRADYSIKAAIDTATHVLSATETIVYTNNSPDALDVLWIQLDQNIYRRFARADFLQHYRPRTAEDYSDGYDISSVTIEDGQTSYVPEKIVTDTRMQLRLKAPLVAKGGLLKIHLTYHYTVPGAWGGRTAVTATKNGDIYEIAQWFPRMAVYDDLRGWDTAPYLGSEFYLDYGDIYYAVTVPWNYIVAGSGSLVNPKDVLTQTEISRLQKASASDATVMIRAPEEVTDAKSRPSQSGTKTWQFHMAHTRDVAFTASPAFVWDAARINLPQGGHALAMSVYPVEAVGPQKWNRSTEYVKFAIEHFSKRWFTYPWPVMVNLGGHGAGMEYPGIVFDDMHDVGRDLFWISVHEVGHSWFPMIVGSNERRDAWMDEGFNTFIDVYASDAFNKGEYAPKRDPEYAEHGGNPVDEILPILADPAAPTIMTPADLITEPYRHPVSYFKPALGLVLLREQILGPERFDAAFRRYIAAWAYKHPAPSDFFRLMESESGEDLAWFWRGWFFANEKLDLAAKSVAYKDAQTKSGLHLEIAAQDPLILPAQIEIIFADGSKQRTPLPVEAFYHGATASFDVPTTKPVAGVVIDPDHVLPDSDRSNNIFTLPPSP
jgi:hypothetical protein